jgi:hypothetical protein
MVRFGTLRALRRTGLGGCGAGLSAGDAARGVGRVSVTALGALPRRCEAQDLGRRQLKNSGVVLTAAVGALHPLPERFQWKHRDEVESEVPGCPHLLVGCRMPAVRAEELSATN